MKIKINKTFIQYIFLILLILVTMVMVFKNLDIKMLTTVVKLVDKKYILIGFISIILNSLLEGAVLRILISGIHKVNAKLIGLKLAMVGFYYNLVTPFASGSQPMQIYVLNKYKIPLSKSSAIITNKSILYQLVITIYCSMLILFNFKLLNDNISSLIPLVILGISMNLFTILMAILVILNPNKIKLYTKIIINYICKIRIFKFLQSKACDIENFIDDYSSAVQFFIKNKKLMICVVVLTIIQISSYFSISFWIYKAFNLKGHTYITLLTLQVFLYMVVSPAPTPGNIGASELAFFTIFKGVFPNYLMGYAVFLYGGFMYYLILIGSGIFTVITHHKLKIRFNDRVNFKQINN